MQTPSSFLTGLEVLLAEVAKHLASGGLFSFLTWLILRKKLKPEIQVIEATAVKTYAEARHLNGETLGNAYERIEELYVIADSQRTQIARLQRECDRHLMNEEFIEEELKWMKSVIDAAGVKLENYGHMRQRVRPRPDLIVLPDESPKS